MKRIGDSSFSLFSVPGHNIAKPADDIAVEDLIAGFHSTEHRENPTPQPIKTAAGYDAMTKQEKKQKAEVSYDSSAFLLCTPEKAGERRNGYEQYIQKKEHGQSLLSGAAE